MEDSKPKVLDENLLKVLEIKLKNLKAEWDFYFTGQRRTPPLKEFENLDKEFKLAKNLPSQDNAIRFKFNSILSNFNAYKELWQKKLKQFEEGKTALRKKSQTEIQLPKQKEIVISRQSNLKEQIEQIYSAYALANEGKGKLISFTEFEKKLREQFLSLFRKTNVSILKIKVDFEEGKLKIKAKPVKEKGI